MDALNLDQLSVTLSNNFIVWFIYIAYQALKITNIILFNTFGQL